MRNKQTRKETLRRKWSKVMSSGGSYLRLRNQCHRAKQRLIAAVKEYDELRQQFGIR